MSGLDLFSGLYWSGILSVLRRKPAQKPGLVIGSPREANQLLDIREGHCACKGKLSLDIRT
jgi:hypothetical protein